MKKDTTTKEDNVQHIKDRFSIKSGSLITLLIARDIVCAGKTGKAEFSIKNLPNFYA